MKVTSDKRVFGLMMSESKRGGWWDYFRHSLGAARTGAAGWVITSLPPSVGDQISLIEHFILPTGSGQNSFPTHAHV
jgi:hypothetical protein